MRSFVDFRIVMPGLMPAIHAFSQCKGVDGRDTPGLYLGTSQRVDNPGAAMTWHRGRRPRIPLRSMRATTHYA